MKVDQPPFGRTGRQTDVFQGLGFYLHRDFPPLRFSDLGACHAAVSSSSLADRGYLPRFRGEMESGVGFAVNWPLLIRELKGFEGS